VNCTNKLDCWSTSAAVFRVSNGRIEWVQTGDSLVGVIHDDGQAELLSPYHNHDRETLGRMAREIPEVVGVKEATADLKQAAEIMEICGEDFTLLSGDDFTILPFLALGGKGVISVISNIEPAKVSQMCAAGLKNDWKQARNLFYNLGPLTRAMFLESNPIPVKTAAALMGKMEPTLRLPMYPLSKEHTLELETLLKHRKLI
jgi:4-hydroxy-tetrahydrodipicolinate synthase